MGGAESGYGGSSVFEPLIRGGSINFLVLIGWGAGGGGEGWIILFYNRP